MHPSQGTANRRFFFHNAMLELVWVRHQREARSPSITPTQLWERWRYRSTGYSPFGVRLRPSGRSALGKPVALPFTTWEYRPPYLPPELHIDVATQTTASEPLVFATPFNGRPDTFSDKRRQPLLHPKDVVEITGLRITLPTGKPISSVVRALHQAGVASFEAGNAHLTEIEFDHGSEGQSADFQPLLPLRFRW